MGSLNSIARPLRSTLSVTVVPIFAANIEHVRFDKTAFFVIEFAFLILAVPREDAQRLIRPNSGIAAHGLVVHRNSAIHAPAFNQVFKNIGDIVALILISVIRADDPPAIILSDGSSAEKGDADGEKDRRNK